MPGTARQPTRSGLAAAVAAVTARARRIENTVGGTPTTPLARLAPLLGLSAAACQISYPLTTGTARSDVAVLIVALLAGTCLTHAATSRSPATALRVLATAGGIGFAAELIGVHTGYPFGGYSYSTALGPRALGVPLIVALAWTMLAWPSAVVARRLVTNPVARVLVGAWALAAADLFLDPQLVALHGWTWHDPTPHLPGIPTVPVANYAGWLLVSLVLSAAMQQVVGDGPDGCAVALYLWLWVGWTVAQLCYLDLPGSAAWGFVGMGVVAAPLLARFLR